MGWQCRLRDEPKGRAAWESVRVGDMWFTDGYTAEDAPAWKSGELSAEYLRDWSARRMPLVIAAPSPRGYRFIPIDTHYSYEPVNGRGWTVTGEPPAITAHPSINLVGDYHGWLRDGVLSDDLEGRTYPHIGPDGSLHFTPEPARVA